MPRGVSEAVRTAAQARSIVIRDFFSGVVKDRETGEPHPFGFWSDVGTITVPVQLPDVVEPENRTFTGAATLISIDGVAAVSNVQVQTVQIRLSQLAPAVIDVVRNYDCRYAPVWIHRGWFSPGARSLVDPAVCRFLGFINRIEIITPEEGGEGGVTVTCVSHTQEMSRASSEKRSHESQLARHAGDDFYKDTAVVGEWEHFWGKAAGKLETVTPIAPGGTAIPGWNRR